MILHPARRMGWDELVTGLEQRIAERTIFASDDGDLRLYHYSRSCVFDARWDPFTELARGLVVDRAERRVVATPFPKFFNLGERGIEIPDEPFEAFDKLDGSLGIVFSHRGRWRVITKGSFGSPQMGWAEQRLARWDQRALVEGSTYLVEIVYAANRIVVSYAWDDLALLGAYDPDGRELPFDEVEALAARVGTRAAARHRFASVREVLEAADALGSDAEGFVLRFASGLRLKIKGERYRRTHRILTRVTPLGLWEAMAAGESLDELRREIPEEYWLDFDRIRACLDRQLAEVLEATTELAAAWADRSDRELGQALQRGELPEPGARFVFAHRKGKLDEPHTRGALLRWIRPDGDRLPGYSPSSGLVGFLASSE